MVKPKSQSKKRGVDFKKIKRKIGRKLPPPKNTTNTEIKSKAIVLPEQSIAAEKAGLAVSKKGLTLKELLQHTSHHNAKVRKDALIGVKDILVNHPAELKLHKLALVEKLRERIGDDDKLVRETLYQLFKTVILPSSAKDNQGPLVSLMMAYIFNAMTNLAIEVRLMAFKFFDIVVQYHPTSFSFYAEKILQNYEDILRRNQLLEDKGKLKNILIGLVQCLSLLPCNESEGYPKMKKAVASSDVLHAFETEVARNPIGNIDITKKSKDLLPVLVSCCIDLMPVSCATPKLDAQSCDCMLYILQSIDLLVRFLVCGKSGSEQYPQLPCGQKPDIATSDTFISILMLKKLWDLFPLNLAHNLSGKDEDKIFMLNTIVTKIFLQLNNWNSPFALLEKFLDFTESSLSIQIQSWKGFHEKHLIPLIPFIPKLTMQISGDWRYRLLQAFTDAFMKCNPESSMKVACLSAIEEMLDLQERSWHHPDANDPALLQYQITWLHYLSSLLILLDVKNPLCSKAVLRLQLCMGKAAPVNSLFSREYDNMQFGFRDFFSQQIDEGTCYGPFIKLSTEIQELAICCLHYFSVVDSQLLQSLVSCCLCDDLKPSIVFRILEALQSSFRAGHVPVAEYTSFHVTLLSRFQIYPEKIFSAMDYDGKSNWKIFKVITRVVCSCLAEIGDDYLVLQMLEKTIVDQICRKAPTDNKCAFLRLLVKLDSSPTRLSDQSIENIRHVLPQYLIDVVSNGEEYYREPVSVVGAKRRQYYLIPCYYLFERSEKLLNQVLSVMATWIIDVNSPSGSQHLHPTDCSTRVRVVASILLHMLKDVKMRQLLLSCITQVEIVLHKLLIVLSSEGFKLTFEEKLKIQSAYDQLREMVDNEVAGHP